MDKTQYVHPTMPIPLSAVIELGESVLKSFLRPQKANRRRVGEEESNQK